MLLSSTEPRPAGYRDTGYEYSRIRENLLNKLKILLDSAIYSTFY